MNAFFMACIALLMFSGLFYLLPSRRKGAVEEDLARANLEWFRLRQAELAQEGAEDLQEDARLRLLEDEQSEDAAGPATAASFPSWILFPIVALLSVVLYYSLGSWPDVVISEQLQGLDDVTGDAEMAQLIQSIETRSAQRPDNLHYLSLLGRFYMGRKEYDRAAHAYGRIADEVPEDAQALALAAQAEFLAAGRQLSDGARLRAEQAVAADPHQRTALGLLGMASFEQGQYRAAIEYWQRLLTTEPPNSESGRMIAEVIETARARLGESAPEATRPVPAGHPVVAAAGGAGITVQVSLPDGAVVDPSHTVFVLARNADTGSRMPIAVQRLVASQLPLTLRLDDSNSMAGQKLSQTPSVIVAVQVSADGRPGEAGASWLGQAGPLAPSVDAEPVEILLQAK